jgi:hypothetical protein
MKFDETFYFPLSLNCTSHRKILTIVKKCLYMQAPGRYFLHDPKGCAEIDREGFPGKDLNEQAWIRQECPAAVAET